MERKNVTYLLLFPIIPYLMANILLLHSFFERKDKSTTIYILILFLSLVLGLINGTKLLESDLLYYYNNFEIIEHISLIDYILLQGREPVFHILSYVLYHTTNGSFKAYIVILTTVSYVIYLTSVYLYGHKLNSKSHVIILLICVAALFPQLFSLSAHLVRQFLAASILCFALVLKFMYQKRVWHFLLTAIFIHSTVFLFIPLIYVPYFRKNIYISKWIIIGGASAIVFLGLPLVSSFVLTFINNPLFSYVFERAASGSGAELETLSLFSIFFISTIVIMILFLNYSYKIHLKSELQIVNIAIVISIFILINIANTEWALRYYFYIYFLFPFVLFLIFKLVKQNLRILGILVFVIFNYLFLYNLVNGVWNYTDIYTILFGNVHTLLNAN